MSIKFFDKNLTELLTFAYAILAERNIEEQKLKDMEDRLDNEMKDREKALNVLDKERIQARHAWGSRLSSSTNAAEIMEASNAYRKAEGAHLFEVACLADATEQHDEALAKLRSYRKESEKIIKGILQLVDGEKGEEVDSLRDQYFESLPDANER